MEGRREVGVRLTRGKVMSLTGDSSLAEAWGGAAFEGGGRRGRGRFSLAVCCFERGDVVEQNLRA